MQGKACKATSCKPAPSGCRETKTNKRDKRQAKRRLFFYLNIIQRVLILFYIYIIINREYITDCIREGDLISWKKKKKRKKPAKEPGLMAR